MKRGCNSKRGQVAMEFLMTYGWAIIIILLAIAALWLLGVFSPSVSSTCQLEAPFNCQDVLIGENAVVLKIATGTDISTATVNSMTVNGQACSSIDGTLNSNQVGDIICTGLTLEEDEKTTAEITISYNRPGGLTKSVEGAISGSTTKLPVSCNDLGGATSGWHQVYPKTTSNVVKIMDVYCDMTTDGGGWTLVWSNLRGGINKPVTNMLWNDAIDTTTRTSFGTTATTPKHHSADLETFNYYIGLGFWEQFGDEIRYDWSTDYGQPLDQQMYADFSFDEANDYTIQMSNYQQKIGSVTAGLYGTHNNFPFSTLDDDNSPGCVSQHSGTPWWYESCWSGSINAGGETEASGHKNGAQWWASYNTWGVPGGQGSGNGWIYVR